MIHKNVKHFFYEFRVKNSELVRSEDFNHFNKNKTKDYINSSIKSKFSNCNFAQHFESFLLLIWNWSGTHFIIFKHFFVLLDN